MATILDVQKNEMELSLQQMQENSDRTRKIHKEVMQRLVHLQESLIKRVPWTANESGGKKSENLSSQLVSKPNLYFSHEYKPPPASSHVIHTLDTPQIPTSRQFCTSTNSVPYVFDKSSVSESVVNSIPPSVSPDDNTIFSGFQSFEKICEENSYVSMLPNFDGDNPRGWIIKARNYFKFKSKLDADMIRLAGLHFIGRASTWYKWFYENKNEQVEWKKFLHDLLLRFDDSEVDLCYLVNPLEIKQQRSVDEYEIEFSQNKEVAEYVYNFVFTEEMLAHNFINGLKEEIREAIDLWSLKTLQGAVNWARFQELRMEENLLFEATEEEYEMYEGMKCMFKENTCPSKATRGYVEGTGITLDIYRLLHFKVRPGNTYLIRGEDFNEKRLNHFDQECIGTNKDDKISQLDDKLIHTKLLMMNIRKCVAACEARKGKSMYKLTTVATVSKGTPGIDEVPPKGTRNEADDFILKGTGVILDLNWMYIMYNPTTPTDDYGRDQRNKVCKPNVHNFDPGGGTLIVVQAAISRGEENNKRQDLSLPDIIILLLGNLNMKFSSGDLGSSLLEKEKDACSFCKCVFLDPMLGHFEEVPRKELARWNIDYSYVIKQLMYENLFDWFCFEPRNDVISAEYFVFLAMLGAYNIYFSMLKCREIRVYSSNYGLLIKLAVGSSIFHLCTESGIVNSMMSFIEHFGLMDNGFKHTSMEMEMQLDKVGEFDGYLVMEMKKNEAGGYTDLLMKKLNGSLDYEVRVTHLVKYQDVYDKTKSRNTMSKLTAARGHVMGGGAGPSISETCSYLTKTVCKVLLNNILEDKDGFRKGRKDEGLKYDTINKGIHVNASLLATGILYDIQKEPEPYRPEFTRLSVHHIIHEVNTPSCHLNAKAAGVAGVYIRTGFTYIYARTVVCCASQNVVVGIQSAKLLNLAALTWRCVNIGETDNEVWGCVLELLLVGFNIDKRVYKGKKIGLEKLIVQNSMRPRSCNKNLARFVVHEYSWKDDDDWKEIDGLIKCTEYQLQTTCSHGFKLDEFKQHYVPILPKVPVVKQMTIDWYWSAITLVFDPGDGTVAKNNKFDSSLRTRIILRGRYCHKVSMFPKIKLGQSFLLGH